MGMWPHGLKVSARAKAGLMLGAKGSAAWASGVWMGVGVKKKTWCLVEFLCVLLLRRQDGWFCAKLDGWAWAATTPVVAQPHPYSLSFLGLEDTYSEKDLENTILAELQKFILEMESDFAFLARQKHFISFVQTKIESVIVVTVFRGWSPFRRLQQARAIKASALWCRGFKATLRLYLLV